MIDDNLKIGTLEDLHLEEYTDDSLLNEFINSDDGDELALKKLKEGLESEIDNEELEELYNGDLKQDLNVEVASEDGVVLDKKELLPEDDLGIKVGVNDFISQDGNIVVMDNKDKSESFRIEYIDIEKIAIPSRIRKNRNVDDLVKSIKSTGLLMPIVVGLTQTEGVYVLIDGFRRMLACAKASIKNVPCIINSKVNTPEIPIIEAMYNHNKKYNVREMVDYIDYLEKEKGVMSATMIEYLLQMNSGEYTKLKDILNDNDENIVEKLYSGVYTIEVAFKKLEQRRKKETAEEKDLKKTEKVYEDENNKKELESITDSGEVADEDLKLSDEEINNIVSKIDVNNLDEGLEEESLDKMVSESKATPGYEDHRQKVGEREYIDPAIRNAVLARDNYTCQCCKLGGESYVMSVDLHHILPVYLGGVDSVDNGVCLCVLCHRLVHLDAVGDLHIPKEKSEEEVKGMSLEEKVLYNNEQMKFKRVLKLSKIIKDAVATRGMKREEFKKKHPVGSIGRNKPGKIQERG